MDQGPLKRKHRIDGTVKEFLAESSKNLRGWDRNAMSLENHQAESVTTRQPFGLGWLEPCSAFVFTIGVTVATLILRLLIDGQVDGRTIVIVFTLPIMLSAYVGGLRAGLLSTGLSCFFAAYFLCIPINSIQVAFPADRWNLFFLAFSGSAISVMIEALHRSRRRSDIDAQELKARVAAVKVGVLQSAIFNSANFSSIATDEKGVIQIFNVGAERMLGYTAFDVVNKITPAEISDPQEVIERAQALTLEIGTPIAPGFEALVFKASRGIEDVYELTYIRKDGTRFPAVVSVTALRDTQGGIIGYLLIGTDNTARRQVEEERKKALRELNDMKKAMNEHALVAITDPQGRITDVNDKFCTISQYSREELIGRDHRLINSCYHPKEYIRSLWTTIARGGVWHGEIKNRAKDGSHYWVDTTIVPYLNEEGKPRQYMAIRADITERKLAEERLNDSLKEVSDLKTALDEHAIVAITDRQGKITYVNDKFCAISKYSREELLGQDHRIINSGYHQKEFIGDLWTTITHGRVWHGEIKNKAKDGSFYWVDTTIVPFLNDRGEPRQYVAIRADITERKLAEEKLQQTNDELEITKSAAEKANLAKSEFLSSMSHELRSPLNAILGFAQLMESAAPAPTVAQTKSIAQILQAGWYLLKLINEILDLSVIESGQVSLSRELVSMSDLMSECQTMMEPQAQQRGVRMTFPRFDSPLYIKADMTRMKQIVINLLSNATKYNKEAGTVVVECRVTSPDRVRISVMDTGTGLPPEKLTQLFQPFNRLGQEAGGVTGTGIGLVVTKRLAELMGGVIGVESTVGVGSIFWCEMEKTEAPQSPTEGSNANALVRSEAPTDNPRRTVLYVEDNPANMNLIEELIARYADIRLMTAVNATLGIELARTAMPMVILMDINLPGINGIKALNILREDPTTAHIPVIAISANAMPRDIAKGLEAGFFSYLTKPIKVKEFMDSLNAALEFVENKPMSSKDEVLEHHDCSI